MFRCVKNKIRLIVLLSFFILMSCSNGHDNKFLPETLGGLKCASIIGNKKAAAIINKMHGKKLDDSENFIAYYGSKDSKNILYVSVYKNPEKAKTNLKSMAMKMAEGTPVFSPLTYSKMGGNVHFETEGMGLKHYFYRVDNILIWWQAEPNKAEATYNDLIRFDFAILSDGTDKD